MQICKFVTLVHLWAKLMETPSRHSGVLPLHLMDKVFVNDTSALFIHLQTTPYFSSNTQLFEKKYIRCVWCLFHHYATSKQALGPVLFVAAKMLPEPSLSSLAPGYSPKSHSSHSPPPPPRPWKPPSTEQILKGYVQHTRTHTRIQVGAALPGETKALHIRRTQHIRQPIFADFDKLRRPQSCCDAILISGLR